MFVEEFIELKNSNKIPNDCKLIKDSVVSQKCIAISDVEQSQSLDERLVVVPDKVLWAAYSKSNGVYSSDGNYVYNYHAGTFIQYLTKDRLIPIKVHDLKNKIKKWRKDNMADFNEKLAQIKKEIGNAPAPAGVQESKAFQGTTQANLAKQENKAKREELERAISAATSQVQLADTRKLKAYNETRSEVIGWITDRDVQIKSRVKTVVVKNPNTKKPEPVDNAPASVIQDLAKGISVERKYLKTNSTLEIVQTAPGPVRFAVVKLPVKGLVPLEDLRNPNANLDISPNEPTDYVIKIFSKKEFAMTTVSLIGDTVKESPITHADPSKIVVKLVGKPVTDKKTKRTENRLTPVISVENKRRLLTPTNYFPRTTYKTIDVASVKTPEDQQRANLSLFGNLFRSVAGRDISYNKLDANEKAKITREGNVITSKFFDPSQRLPLGVRGVFTGAAIANPAIVEKIERPTKDGKGTTLRAISYNAAAGKEDEYGISPFKDPRFAKFIEACGGVLTEASLKELYKKSTNTSRSSSKVELSSTEATKVFLASALSGGTSSLKFDARLTESELDKIDSDLLKTVNEFAAR